MYRSLDAARIVETAEALQKRVSERFPGSGLGRLSAELLQVTREAAALSSWLGKPHLLVRAGVGACVVAVAAVLFGACVSLHLRWSLSTVTELIQAVESGVNDLIFLGVAVFFLVTWEGRRKRARALKALHQLRSMAHIVDMHQLTKDPERVARAGPDTPSSPKRQMSPFELMRYLDYCSESLSVISKVAALYVQDFDDPVTLGAVNEVENLTAGLSRKVWQKIMILDRMAEGADGGK